MTEPIRVLLADDQRMFREAIRALLEVDGDIVVVAEATTGHDAVEQAIAHDVDVALLDIEMPDGDGLDAATVLRDRRLAAVA